MLVAIIFAHAWGVIELAALGSVARTTGLRTLFAAMAAGLYGCAAVALIFQISWTRPAAWLTGTSLSDLVRIASYTADPVIEEIVKVLPLVALLMVRVVKRQWSLTDCVLVGAATGSGFGLAEDLFRYSASASRAVAIDGGWVAERNLFAFLTIPSPWATMTSWLPAGAAFNPLFSSGSVLKHLNLHLAWSAIGGLAVGLMMLRGGRLNRWLGAALLLYVGGDHAVFNAGSQSGLSLAGVISAPFNVLRPLLWLMPIVALAFAWWLDRRLLSVTSPELVLAAERAATPPWRGTIQIALASPPWSLLWVDGLVRLRRADIFERASRPDESSTLHEFVIDLRRRIELVVSQPGRVPVVPTAWTKVALRQTLRQPVVIAWIVLVTPSVLWFVVGGLPQTAWVQAALATGPVWAVLRLLSLPALAWLAWQTIEGFRQWPQVMRSGVGDMVAVLSMRLLAGAGALALGAYMFVVAVTANGPNSSLIDNFHILDAFGRALAITGLLLALMALFMFPTGGLLALVGGGSLGGGITANLVATLAGVLGFAGVVLMTASDYPPDFQYGDPTKLDPDDPHVAPDPNAPKPPGPLGPYRRPPELPLEEPPAPKQPPPETAPDAPKGPS